MATAKSEKGLEGKSLEELQEIIRQATEALEAQKGQRREEDLKTVLYLVSFHGFKAQDLGLQPVIVQAPAPAAKRGRKPGSSASVRDMKGEKVIRLYKHPEKGEYRTGAKGKPPGWVSDAKKSGTLEQFFVEEIKVGVVPPADGAAGAAGEGEKQAA